MEAGTGGSGRQAVLSVPRKGQGENICWEGAGRAGARGLLPLPGSSPFPPPPSIHQPDRLQDPRETKLWDLLFKND